MSAVADESALRWGPRPLLICAAISGRGRASVVAALMCWFAGAAPLAAATTDSTAHAARTLQCRHSGVKGISDLTAGVTPGGDPAYGADCGGAVDSAKSFVQSRCSKASVSLRKGSNGKYRICSPQYEECLVKEQFSKRSALIWCIPPANENALVTFHYKFSR